MTRKWGDATSRNIFLKATQKNIKAEAKKKSDLLRIKCSEMCFWDFSYYLVLTNSPSAQRALSWVSRLDIQPLESI